MGKTYKKKYKVEIKLKVAQKKDLIEIDGYKKDGKKKWKLKTGIPFWLISSKGEIENKNYILSNETDKDDLAIWILKEQLLIPK